MKSKKPAIDPKSYLDEVFKDAEKRGSWMLASPSMLQDEDWARIEAVIYKRGPLTKDEELPYLIEHDTVCRLYMMDLFFECRRLYSLINWLNPIIEKGEDDGEKEGE